MTIINNSKSNKNFKIIERNLYVIVILFKMDTENGLEEFQERISEFLTNPKDLVINFCCTDKIPDSWISSLTVLKNNLSTINKKMKFVFVPSDIQNKILSSTSELNREDICSDLLEAIERFK
ncbi:MAG: hypothetical protein HQK49_07570 [Oligoflexia bacterium]|nr:hypothetical protein [Oligoflexia bacterium]